jgi:hypothetical protein
MKYDCEHEMFRNRFWIVIQRDGERLPTTPFSLVFPKEYFEALTQYITFSRGGRGESVLLYSVVFQLQL